MKKTAGRPLWGLEAAACSREPETRMQKRGQLGRCASVAGVSVTANERVVGGRKKNIVQWRISARNV